jgi:hypothetical protein
MKSALPVKKPETDHLRVDRARLADVVGSDNLKVREVLVENRRDARWPQTRAR